MAREDKNKSVTFVEFEKSPTLAYFMDDDRVREAVETVEMLQDIETIVLGFRKIMERKSEQSTKSS